MAELQLQIENEAFLTQQLITYIGNKRTLLGFIARGIENVIGRLNKTRLSTFDVFSGSGIVARFLKRYATSLIANDIERYAEITNRCYLANMNELDLDELATHYRKLKHRLATEPLRSGFITELYAPDRDDTISHGERVFYTRRNAMYLDTAREYIEDVPERLRHFFIGPLLSEASVHANTAGVFKGFYKNSRTGIGQFGGNNRDALSRILGEIDLPFPVFSDFDCDVRIFREDANELVRSVDEVDLAYIDPPYNQHPYGSNYFMLNLIADYTKPVEVSRVSGIPSDWRRSRYNKPQSAHDTFRDLVTNIRAKFLVISFNSDGFIAKEEMLALLKQTGKVEVIETEYNTFRGSRNLTNRDIHVKEYLYLVEKS